MSADRPAEEELAALCAAQGLQLVERLEASGASRFVAHVIDSAGRHSLLKRGTGLRGNAEAAVLTAFAQAGCVPGRVEVLDDSTFLCDWVEGVVFEPSEGDVSSRLRECGRLLRALHRSPLPDVRLMPISRRASAEWVERDLGSALTEPLVQRAKAAARDLADCNPADKVLLHGDVVPQNILVAGDRTWFIDPIGFVGPAGWDVAQLAVAVHGRDRRENLADLVAGYGATPPKIEPAFAYLAMVFYAKNLEMEREQPGSRAQLVAELGALVESL